MSVWSQTAEGIRLKVRVQPRASRNRVAGLHGDAIKLQVTAPPVEGAANDAVIDLVATWLAVPRRTVSIAHGQTGRDKLVDVAVAEPAQLAARLNALLAPPGEAGEVDKPKSRD